MLTRAINDEDDLVLVGVSVPQDLREEIEHEEVVLHKACGGAVASLPQKVGRMGVVVVDQKTPVVVTPKTSILAHLG